MNFEAARREATLSEKFSLLSGKPLNLPGDLETA